MRKLLGSFEVDPAFPASPEEIALLRQWGFVLEALANGVRQPQTDRQRLFVQEVRGEVYALSASAKAWIRYATWRTQTQAEREAGLAATRAIRLSECEANLKAAEAQREWEAWMKEHGNYWD
jgi:hypothetical protein